MWCIWAILQAAGGICIFSEQAWEENRQWQCQSSAEASDKPQRSDGICLVSLGWKVQCRHWDDCYSTPNKLQSLLAIKKKKINIKALTKVFVYKGERYFCNIDYIWLINPFLILFPGWSTFELGRNLLCNCQNYVSSLSEHRNRCPHWLRITKPTLSTLGKTAIGLASAYRELTASFPTTFFPYFL